MTKTRGTAADRKAFERWMRRQWSGVNLQYSADINEYVGGPCSGLAAQIGWEVWQRFSKRGVK